jgi:hypothetical protein
MSQTQFCHRVESTHHTPSTDVASSARCLGAISWTGGAFGSIGTVWRGKKQLQQQQKKQGVSAHRLHGKPPAWPAIA